jgi:hypothetical protein
VLQTGRYRALLRQWVAAGASCALVLQLLLSAIVLGHSTLALAGANGDAFVICHGAGTSPGQNEPGNLPPEQSHCLLCTIATTPCAILPAASAATSLDAGVFSQLKVPPDAQVTAYRSPTGEYQRGPPTHSPFSADLIKILLSDLIGRCLAARSPWPIAGASESGSTGVDASETTDTAGQLDADAAVPGGCSNFADAKYNAGNRGSPARSADTSASASGRNPGGTDA